MKTLMAPGKNKKQKKPNTNDDVQIMVNGRVNDLVNYMLFNLSRVKVSEYIQYTVGTLVDNYKFFKTMSLSCSQKGLKVVILVGHRF